MTPEHGTRLGLRVMGLLLAGVLVTGCSDDEEPSGSDGSPTPSAASTPAPSASESEPAEPPSEDPSSDPVEPTTEPAGATGPRLQLDPVELRAPEGYELTESLTPFEVSAVGGGGIQGNQVLVISAPTTSGGTLDDLARSEATLAGARLSILEPVTVSGVEMAHVRGISGGILTDSYVAIVGSDRVSITFGYDGGRDADKAFQQALMDEVLATVQWAP